MPFGFYRSITIDHTKCGSVDSQNWPFTFATTDATLKTVSNGGNVQNANGYDIGFFKDSALTQPLPFEIQRYNGTTGEFIAGVKLENLSAASDTVIYIAYGDATITTSQASGAIWDNSFRRVYHLGDGTALNLADSTGGQTATNGGATATAGLIDGAANLGGSAEIDMSPNSQDLNISRDLTIEILFKEPTISVGGSLASHGSGGWYFRVSGSKLQFLKSQVAVIATGATTLSDNTWYYGAVTINAAGDYVIFLNATTDASGNTAQTFSSGFHAYMGTEVTGGGTHNERFNGVFDEFRFSRVARSASWCNATANNLLNPGSFYTLGTEAAFSAPVPIANPPNDHLGPMGFLGIPSARFRSSETLSSWAGRLALGTSLNAINVPKLGVEVWAGVDTTETYLEVPKLGVEVWMTWRSPPVGFGQTKDRLGPKGFLGIPPERFKSDFDFNIPHFKGPTQLIEADQALEIDSAFDVEPIHAGILAQAIEVDSAFEVTAYTGVQFIIYETDIIALAPLALPASLIPTPQAVELIAGLNWTQLTDIAGSVTGAEREALAGTGRTVRVESTEIETRQLPARAYRLPSLYRYEVDAYARALQILRWLEGGLKAYSVTIDRFRNQIEIGHVAKIDYYPRFGLQNGFTGAVVGWSEVPAKGQVTLVLIGTTPS